MSEKLSVAASTLIDRFLSAAPQYKDEWTAYSQSSQGDDDDVAAHAYVDLGELAHYLVSSLRRGDDSGFADVFETIERLVGSGDSAIRNLVIVGFLEDLQNISLNKSIELAAWN